MVSRWSHCANDEVWLDEDDVNFDQYAEDAYWQSLLEQERYT